MATKLEIAEQRYEITQAAITALEHLDLLLTGDLAYPSRVQTTGR